MEKQKDLLDALFKDLGKAIELINKYLFYMFICLDIFYFVYSMISGSFESKSLFKNILLYIGIPTFVEFAILELGSKYIKDLPNVSKKGSGVLLVTELMLGMRILLHNSFESVYVLMCIPLFLGVFYGSHRLVKVLFKCGIGIFCIVFVLSHISMFIGITGKFYVNFIVSVIIFCCCYYCADKYLIEFEKSKESIIDKYKDEYEVISNEACTDGLTRLYNFKTLESQAEDWIKTKNNVIFCIIDIDNFKKVNDTYGHEFGNVVLRRLSLLLSYRSKENIFVARYGGEEFAVLAHSMNMRGMFNMMDKLRRAFKLEEYRETKEVYTFSGGLAEYKMGMSVTDLFEAADKKLYHAKHTGKNRISF